MKHQSAEVQSLEKREEALSVGMYVGIGLILAGVVVENLPALIGSPALISTKAHGVGAAEIALGLAIEVWADVALRKVRNRLKGVPDICESKMRPSPELVVGQAKPSEV